MTIKKKDMSAIKVFKEAVEVLKALSAAAASARSEVQQLLVVLEGECAVADNKIKGPPGFNEPAWNQNMTSAWG